MPRHLLGVAQLWEYRAVVLYVVDGDTFDVRVDKGFDDDGQKMRLRLFGLDTWEDEGATREAGLAATAFTRRWLAEHADVNGRLFIRTTRSTRDVDKADSFGRYLATVYNLVDGQTQGAHCLNVELIAGGHTTGRYE